MTLAVVRSRSSAVVLLLLIHCLFCLWGFVFGICFVMQYSVFFLVLQLSWGGSESWLHYFNGLTDAFECLFSVALPHGAVGWSAVCGCRISWSYSLTFNNIHVLCNCEKMMRKNMTCNREYELFLPPHKKPNDWTTFSNLKLILLIKSISWPLFRVVMFGCRFPFTVMNLYVLWKQCILFNWSEST